MMDERKEAKALMKRLEAQFGDIDLDLELLGLGDEEQVALELEQVEKEQATSASQTPSSAPEANQNETIADAEAAALMARLAAQFGDLDMSQLGVGVDIGGGEATNITSSNIDNSGRDSDEESSLEEPTPEELAAWQASQFSKGEKLRTEKQASLEGRTVDSISQRRKLLREKRSQQLTSEQVRLRFQNQHPQSGSLGERIPKSTASSVLDLLGRDTSTFFGPSTSQILENLVSEEANGDSEILQTSWKRLYASYEEGLGFWNLWRALKGYDGPTLLILRCLPSASKSLEVGEKTTQNTACIGFYTTTPWKDSSDMFGGDIECQDGDKAFLFSIDEKNHKVRFFPVEPKPGAKHSMAALKNGYMYCQPSSKKDGTTGIAKTIAVTGLGVGGRPTQPRFHLTESFEDCSCLTYDSSRVTRDGDLFSCFDDDESESSANTTGSTKSSEEGHAFAKTLYSFDVTELEAWGIGGTDWIEHALQERERARKQHILRYQKVDKQMMWDQGAFGSNNNRRKTSQS